MFRKQKECNCDWSAIAYVKTDVNLQLSKAIERVRELAEKFEQEPQDEMVNYHLVARRIFTAIKDGEQ